MSINFCSQEPSPDAFGQPSQVKAEAVVAVPAPIVSQVARSTVHAGAVEAARAPRLNIYGMAY
jgi:hypothetical protein